MAPRPGPADFAFPRFQSAALTKNLAACPRSTVLERGRIDHLPFSGERRRPSVTPICYAPPEPVPYLAFDRFFRTLVNRTESGASVDSSATFQNGPAKKRMMPLNCLTTPMTLGLRAYRRCAPTFGLSYCCVKKARRKLGCTPPGCQGRRSALPTHRPWLGADPAIGAARLCSLPSGNEGLAEPRQSVWLAPTACCGEAIPLPFCLWQDFLA